MTLFRETDKVITPVVPDDPDAGNGTADYGDFEDGPYDIVQYVASARVIRDRLDVMGYTLQAALRTFEIALAAQRVEHTASMERLRPHLSADFVDTDAAVLAELTVEKWLEGLREIRDKNLKPTSRSDPELDSLSPLVAYMLGKFFDGWYGFPSSDVRHAIRLAVEVCPTDDLIYDLTDLVLAGYFDATDDLVATADYLITEDFEVTRRVIVLTEGSSDKWILEKSFDVLCPHLADFYRFMDFEGARVAGGAGALASMVKAFIGAGILNRVVAVFDNDTAGTAAMRTLQSIHIPRNIVVMQYPRLKLAEAYPTLGPSGLVEMDVNGLAASIELYLGRDVLMNDGSLTPIQWKGYDEQLGRYQGEVTEKKALHTRFLEKLHRAQDDPEGAKGDWSGLESILASLRSAFHSADEEEMIASEIALASRDGV